MSEFKPNGAAEEQANILIQGTLKKYHRRGLDSIRLHNDSIRKSVSTKKGKGEIIIGTDDDDRDPYDDPDFDDLIPGEEYDEEFVDRSQGDPELYN